jgi:nitroreductase
MTMQLPKTEMNVFETILARRSVRSYTAQEIDRATVRILLEAAVHAPTAIHEEPWAFVIIQDSQLLQQLSDQAKPLFAEEARRPGRGLTSHIRDNFASPDFNIFHDAGTLIIICAKPTGAFAAADCWLAAENLMLAACAMELGTCVIGMALPALSVVEVKVKFGIPDEFSAIAPIIVGHPRGETAPTPRKEPLILSYLSATGGL